MGEPQSERATARYLRACSATPLVFLVLSCGAGRNVEHPAPAEHLPHITWAMATGKDKGDTSVVCSSEESARPCVLEASAPGTPRFATVSVDFHAAAQAVAYTGTITPGFLVSSRPHDVKQQLEPKTEVKTVSIVDAVTSTPGAYTLDVELSGMMANTNHLIKLSVPVTVK